MGQGAYNFSPSAEFPKDGFLTLPVHFFQSSYDEKFNWNEMTTQLPKPAKIGSWGCNILSYTSVQSVFLSCVASFVLVEIFLVFLH